MNTVAIILARQGSKRFPNKVMKDICGTPMIGRIVDRLRKSEKIDQVVVATNPSSKELILYCKAHQIDYFVGSEYDVLDRLYRAAQASKADIIVRVWHDSPLIDYRLIDRYLGQFLKDRCPCAIIKGFPKGLFFNIMRFDVLEYIVREMTTTDRAIWNEYSENLIWETLRVDVKIFENIEDLSHINLSVDTQEDLDRIREIYAGSQTDN